MKILTRDFGEIDAAEDDIITFVSPMFGFDELSKYVFLFAEENTSIVWMQSVENPHVCFILADPGIVESDYHPQLSDSVRETLGEGDYLFWLVMVVAEDFRDSTINMKSPVVVNMSTRRGVQIILEENLPLRRPLPGSQEGR